MVGGSKYEVLEGHEIDGHFVLRVRWNPGGERWYCTFAEYLTIKPLSMKAWCQHCEWAVMGEGAAARGLNGLRYVNLLPSSDERTL